MKAISAVGLITKVRFSVMLTRTIVARIRNDAGGRQAGQASQSINFVRERFLFVFFFLVNLFTVKLIPRF